MRRARLLAVLLAAGAFLGCGYTLVGKGSNLPPEVKKVYLKAFVNSTERVRVDQILTQAVADELVNRQRFEVVSSEAGADAELDGTVVAFEVTPVTFDADRRATEYEITITVQAQLRQFAPDRVLWKNDRYQFRNSYPLDTSELGFQDRETPAIQATAKKFAETMVSDLLEGF
jgi:outer membrane lipopolysaccharide assembly protein LptE/RlpB